MFISPGTPQESSRKASKQSEHRSNPEECKPLLYKTFHSDIDKVNIKTVAIFKIHSQGTWLDQTTDGPELKDEKAKLAQQNKTKILKQTKKHPVFCFLFLFPSSMTGGSNDQLRQKVLKVSKCKSCKCKLFNI